MAAEASPTRTETASAGTAGPDAERCADRDMAAPGVVEWANSMRAGSMTGAPGRRTAAAQGQAVEKTARLCSADADFPLAAALSRAPGVFIGVPVGDRGVACRARRAGRIDRRTAAHRLQALHRELHPGRGAGADGARPGSGRGGRDPSGAGQHRDRACRAEGRQHRRLSRVPRHHRARDPRPRRHRRAAGAAAGGAQAAGAGDRRAAGLQQRLCAGDAGAAGARAGHPLAVAAGRAHGLAIRAQQRVHRPGRRLAGLAKRYALPQQPQGLDHGLAYRALAESQIDLTDIYTTDAQIAALGLTVLEDDRHFFPRYDAVLLYRVDLPQRHPQAWAALQALQGRIDEAAMIAMNAEAEIRKRPPGLWARLTGPDLARLTWQHLTLVLGAVALAALVGVRWRSRCIPGRAGASRCSPSAPCSRPCPRWRCSRC
ncbi:substrate binding domain of ABC-type glycine betaine transport system domain-containing protein [Ditylenchus destructor]|nr:substrate binding domain of ABC-type glycine betaine transport system domain-containing protein [Ditylenchus destructor]